MDLQSVLASDFLAVSAELPVICSHEGSEFVGNRSTYRRDNSVGDGGFFSSIAMTITCAYNAVTQLISLGDVIYVEGRIFRVMSADLSQDAVSVDFVLEDVNK